MTAPARIRNRFSRSFAQQYADRCYKALIEGDDFLKKEPLETLLKKWPEFSQP